jgi:multidrug efflux pump subunit AcrA (membrane-fusion protein)
MKRFIRGAWLLSLLPAGLPALGCGGGGAAPSGPPPQPPPVVSVSKAVVKDVTDYEDFPGRIEALNMVEVRARVTGYLQTACFKEGAEVKKGDLLFEIDPKMYQAELAFAEGSITQMEGRLARLELDYRRANDLMRKNAVSREDYDKVVGDRVEALGALEVAKASRDKAKFNLDWTKVKAPLDGRISRRFIDPGNMVKADETALTTIVSLDPVYVYFDLDERSTLRGQRLLREGKVTLPEVKPMPVLLGLADEEKMCGVRVWLDVAKAKARGLSVKDVEKSLRALADVNVTSGPVDTKEKETTFTLIFPFDPEEPHKYDAENLDKVVLRTASDGQATHLADVARVERCPKNMGFPRRGLIDFTDNRVDPDTGTWRLRATFRNPDQALYPGLYVRIRLPIGNEYEATLVSQQALGTDQGQKFLYVLKTDKGKGKDGKDLHTAEYRRVKIGRLHDGLCVITEGLKSGEKVIVSGLQRVRPGIEINIEEVPMPVLTAPGRTPGAQTQPKKGDSAPPKGK